MDFAEQRKIYQAEYQLLSQEYELKEKQITVSLMHPVQETMLNNMRSELAGFLREQLKNNSLIVVGELKISDDKKMMYTARDKFEYMAEKNPWLNELKDRLGLDTDF
jgi:DNA polymerase-3 subunit gamma/tau